MVFRHRREEHQHATRRSRGEALSPHLANDVTVSCSRSSRGNSTTPLEQQSVGKRRFCAKPLRDR